MSNFGKRRQPHFAFISCKTFQDLFIQLIECCTLILLFLIAMDFTEKKIEFTTKGLALSKNYNDVVYFLTPANFTYCL